jgi:hypothetical protein
MLGLQKAVMLQTSPSINHKPRPGREAQLGGASAYGGGDVVVSADAGQGMVENTPRRLVVMILS